MGAADKMTLRQREQFVRKLREQEECTYVALALGRPRKGAWKVCSEKCHITIGYAAWMWAGERIKLQNPGGNVRRMEEVGARRQTAGVSTLQEK